MGDGWLVEFASAVEAVNVALRTQGERLRLETRLLDPNGATT